MLINHQGKVFAGKRIDQTVEGWQMPQGGIDDGEDPRAAAMRELIGRGRHRQGRNRHRTARLGAYDLPAHLIGVAFHGNTRGQRRSWFLMRFTGQDNGIDLYAHEPEFSDWKWFGLDEIPNLIVPFKRPTYEVVIAGFRAFVQPRQRSRSGVGSSGISRSLRSARASFF